MSIDFQLNCCGMCDFQGMNDKEFTPEKLFWELFLEYEDNVRPFVILSWRVEPQAKKNLNVLNEYLKKHQLGTIFETKMRKNPGSGHNIKAAILQLNTKTVNAHNRKNSNKWEKEFDAYDEVVDDWWR